MKEKTVDQTIASMRRAAKRLTKEHQSAMGIKLVLWADKIDKAIQDERKEVLKKVFALDEVITGLRMEVSSIRAETTLKGQYGN